VPRAPLSRGVPAQHGPHAREPSEHEMGPPLAQWMAQSEGLLQRTWQSPLQVTLQLE
jgi:hypothetical protein